MRGRRKGVDGGWIDGVDDGMGTWTWSVTLAISRGSCVSLSVIQFGTNHRSVLQTVRWI